VHQLSIINCQFFLRGIATKKNLIPQIIFAGFVVRPQNPVVRPLIFVVHFIFYIENSFVLLVAILALILHRQKD
jgi:hypothetical protein